MKKTIVSFVTYFIVLAVLNGCNNNAGKNVTSKEGETKSETNSETKSETSAASKGNFNEGTDYLIYERVRLFDKMGFAVPVEAYSLLLPKGWTHEGDIIWNNPGQSCNGTFKWFKAKSADGKFSLEILPDLLFSWNTNQELMQFNQNNSNPSSYCSFHEPMDAAQYFRNEFLSEIGSPQAVKTSSNQLVVDQMRQMNEQYAREATQYGGANIQFGQTAINADVKWQDNSEGFVVLGVTMAETDVPNAYNGTSDKLYTTLVTKRVVFKYPAAEAEQAKLQFSLIMGSVRTNPSWNDAVNKFWKDFRQQRQRDHIGRIEIMDAQTRAIGEAAIAKGNERLKTMDSEYRSWEAQQSSQDRMHTNFIKTIREVENFRDETGKYEMVSGYNHAWSRSDGTSFIMSDNPNFDPSSVLQDQQWKEMKKVND